MRVDTACKNLYIKYMNTAKLKPSAPKPIKAAATRVSRAPKASAALGPAKPPSGTLPGVVLLGGNALHKARLSDRLLNALGPMFEVNITNARTQMPKMIKSSVGGKVFVIGNAKSADSPPAVLIGMAELERVVQEAAKPAPSRTLGEILDSLPYSGMDLRSPRVEALPGGGLPTVRIPK